MYGINIRLLLYLFVLFAVACLGSLAVKVCPPRMGHPRNLIQHGPVCYLFINQEKTWTDAQKDCHNKGGYMVEVTNQTIQRFLVSSLKALNWTRNGVWLGGTDNDKEGAWMWDTGRNVTYTNWAPGQEGSHSGWLFGHNHEITPNEMEDCVQLRLSDRNRWHDFPCNVPVYIYSYICQFAAVESAATTRSTTPTPTTRKITTTTTTLKTLTINLLNTTCPHNLPSSAALRVRQNGPVCYLFVSNTKTWIQAQNDCHAKGGYLAEVLDQNTQNFLVASLRSMNWTTSRVWIGATEQNNHGTWRWDSGRALGYSHWAPGQSTHGSIFSPDKINQCVLLWMRDPMQRWYSYPCDAMLYAYYYICQFGTSPLSSTTTTTTPKPTTTTPKPTTTTPKPTTPKPTTITPKPTTTTPKSTTTTPKPTTTTPKPTTTTPKPTTTTTLKPTTTTPKPTTSTPKPTTTTPKPTTTTPQPTTTSKATTQTPTTKSTTTTRQTTARPTTRAPTTTTTTSATTAKTKATTLKSLTARQTTLTTTKLTTKLTTAVPTTTPATTTKPTTTTTKQTRRNTLIPQTNPPTTTPTTAAARIKTPSSTQTPTTANLQSQQTSAGIRGTTSQTKQPSTENKATTQSQIVTAAPSGGKTASHVTQAPAVKSSTTRQGATQKFRKQPDSTDGDGDALDQGALAGIIVGSIGGIVVIGLLIAVIYKSRHSWPKYLYSEQDVAFENFGYGTSVTFKANQDNAVQLLNQDYPESKS